MRRTRIRRSGCAPAKFRKWRKNLVGLAQIGAIVLAVAWGVTGGESFGQVTDNNGNDMTGIVINNSGTITNTGTMDAGLALINTGSITNTETMNAGILVTNFGTIQGISEINAPLITNSGTLAPSNGDGPQNLVINGNLLNTGALLPAGTVEIGFYGDDWDTIDVNGNAVINGGNVAVKSVDDRYSSGHYKFLTANDIRGNGFIDDVTGGSPLFNYTLDRDGNVYSLDISRTTFYGGRGNTYNQRAVGRYLDEIGSKRPGGDFADVLLDLDQLTTDAQKLYALDQMSGAIYGTLADNSITNTSLANSTLNDVLRRDAFCNRCAPVCYDPCAPACGTYSGARGPFCRNLWGLVYGTGGHTRHDGNAYGYDQSYLGTLIGLDKLYGHATRAGIYTSYGEGRLSSNLKESAKTRELLVGLYLRKNMYIGYLLLSGGLGYNQYDVTREITFADRTASGRRDAIVGTVYGERGLEFQGPVAKWQPFLGLQYIGNQQNGFSETGADSLNLEGDITTQNSFRSLLGTRLSKDIARSHSGTLALSGQAYWMHEFTKGTYSDFSSQFSNPGGAYYASDAKLMVHGNNAARDWAVLGTGLNYDFGNWRLLAGYDITMNRQQVLHTGNAGFAYGW